MKREFGNKDFLPYRLIKVKENKLNKGNKLWAALLLIVSLFLLPMSIERIVQKEEVIKESPVVEEQKATYSKDSIVYWVELLNGVDEGSVQNFEGTFILGGKKEMDGFVMNKSIIINSVESIEEGKFKMVAIRANQ